MQPRSLLELSEHKARSWSDDELWHHHRMLSDVSPWLNAQGTSMHHQIIDEIKRRNGDSATF
ncbi:hypothetical protein [Gorillibacterium sp. sgz5001074]|uniref:hypothetical protein n=1 Tax=Gorillibacterium sp. sgz5001074 TaxID=3446695 RepID=UPI003F66333D